MGYEEVMTLLMWIDTFDGNVPPPAIFKPKPLWTGKQIFSLIIPEINMTTVSSTFDGKLEESHRVNLCDTEVLISKGELLSGIVDKKTVGASSGSLIHLICMEHGNAEAAVFLTQCQKMVNAWLQEHSFSVGVSDIIADSSTTATIA